MVTAEAGAAMFLVSMPHSVYRTAEILPKARIEKKQPEDRLKCLSCYGRLRLMDDFDELIPGSWLAKRRGCTCEGQAGPDFRADPACPMHGIAEFKRVLQSAAGKSAIDRFRRHVQQRQVDTT